MSLHFDTIFAPISGLPPAAVSIVRLSGPDAWQIAGTLFQPWPDAPAPRLALYGRFSHGDDGLALPFEEGHSFTGEQTVELSIHGSRASLHALLLACESAGARPAQPGEFTQRAFLNGRIDLTQAEAVRETIEADTSAQLHAANRNRAGHLRTEIKQLRDEVIRILAAVEASVDFSDEIGDLDRPLALQRLHAVSQRIEQLASGAAAARLVREGLRIAIVGPPNAGKSSLLNTLLGMDRAIVSEIAGTTRDYVEERADFQGYAVVLVDTAGLRSTTDLVESIGVQRARAAAADADMVWYIHDAAIGLTEEDRTEIAAFQQPLWVVANKSDLAVADGISVSAKTGSGIERLVQMTVDKIQHSAPAVSLNNRQRQLLESALATLQDAEEHLDGDTPADLLSVLLNELLATLGEITGESATHDAIERIFSEFCIGK